MQSLGGINGKFGGQVDGDKDHHRADGGHEGGAQKLRLAGQVFRAGLGCIVHEYSPFCQVDAM